MRFKDVFSIIGPSMVGPSSSHTAGAVRLGRTARSVAGGTPEEAVIDLYGSFATTYQGHGTDLALVAGLLGFDTDDDRIKNAIAIGEAVGMKVVFRPSKLPAAHPNTATFRLKRDGREVTVTGCSIGGGNVEIVGIDHFDVKFTANYPTLLICHDDRSGIIADITAILRQAETNIGYMEVDRKSRNGDALTVIESDEPLGDETIGQIAGLANVRRVSVIDLAKPDGEEER